MCGASEREKNVWNLKKKKEIKYTHDTAITNGQVHHWRLKIKIYLIYF